MVFIETPVFTRRVLELLDRFLVANPKAGDSIAGTGGLRKVRWGAGGAGKRGGVRVIYFHVTPASQIRMLLVYRKGIKDDLTPAEKKQLRQSNADWR